MKKIVALLLNLLVAPAAFAASATISFVPPTTYTNGSPLPAASITGYDLRCTGFTPTGGTAGACDAPPLSIPGTAKGGEMIVAVPVEGGEACFTATTKTALSDSAPSVPSCKVFPSIPPAAPTNLKVISVIIVP